VNANIPRTAALWNAVDPKIRGAWFALSGLQMPELVESVEALVTSEFDQFDDSESLVLALAFEMLSSFAIDLFRCGVIRIEPAPRNPENADSH